MQIPTSCHLCPRNCGVDRNQFSGRCKGGKIIKIARAALHHWEEPCISGTQGSGTVFFSGCNLHCCYCQNYQISFDGYGKEVSIPQLANIFLKLQQQKAHNINLVTAGHWAIWVIEAIKLAKEQGLKIPIVYNTSSYETVETIDLLSPYIDIWLADIKYFSPICSEKYSNAKDYFLFAEKAILRMFQHTPVCVWKEDNTLKKGVILRHLALPGNSKDSKAILNWISTLPKQTFLFSLMSQYTPCHQSTKYKELGRKISTWEYKQLINTAYELGLTQGYMQDKSSACIQYRPSFDLTGIL